MVLECSLFLPLTWGFQWDGVSLGLLKTGFPLECSGVSPLMWVSCSQALPQPTQGRLNDLGERGTLVQWVSWPPPWPPIHLPAHAWPA